MSGTYASYPITGGGGVPIYATIGSFPAGSTPGQLAVAADTGSLYEWNGSAWVLEATPGSTVVSIGTLDSEGTPSVNGATIASNALILQSASTSDAGLVNTTTQNIAGVKTFTSGINVNSTQINAVEDPTSAQQAATKNYVDTVASGLQPIEACFAASTATIAGTYVSVGSGVGDTFTVTATGALSIDGTSPGSGARILLKNQSSGYQNGVYTVTVVGSLGVSPVLTRATDYDTPAEINAGDLVPVINGTANAVTSWLQTATIASIGPSGTALVFVEWSYNPANFLLKANNLSDVASAATSFNNISPITAKGDLIVGSGTDAATNLAIGTTSQALIVVGGTAAWGTLPVLGGGTGLTTTTQYGLYVGGSTNMAQLAVPASGTVLQGVSAGNPVFTATPTHGVNGTTGGTLALANATSGGGSVTIQNLGTTSGNAYNFNLPATAGSSGQALISAGGSSSSMTWGSVVTNPMTTLGDIIYGGASGTPTRLAGNTTTTPNFYTSTGASSAATAPTLTASTGSGNVVLATSPTLVTPALGTPSALVGTNITGTASGLTAGNVTTNANLTGDVTSVGNATSLVATSNATLTTLSALTTASSLASVGTITSGTWNGTTIAIANGGTGGTSLTSGGTGGSGSPALSSGTYSPANPNNSGVTAITLNTANWLRVGNVVHVSGTIVVTVTGGGGSYSYIGMPTTNGNFTSGTQCAGTAVAYNSTLSAVIQAVPSNDYAQITWAGNGSNTTYAYNFTYSVQ